MNKILKIDNIDFSYESTMCLIAAVTKASYCKHPVRCQLPLYRILKLEYESDAVEVYTPKTSTEVTATINDAENTVLFAYGPGSNHYFTKSIDNVLDMFQRFTGADIEILERKS